ncbi:CaiB/BaiF CoA transferase family protein [Cupriavidus consociatus]|uniref:CaiB/BaiF CoA transferase family protein n=1 Tax=Cupriavidus consociatus TaxID=2821357 RepID=UPI001AE6B218|nr:MULTISPECIES: CoA transferase [unclassified Cupriavidus]MBP0624068.1 CoA transferase [Cupriavidus sp. LEh25]MDK2660777.1 CoA transferase [Cupriavidus sp. LEh21]
MTDPTSLPLSGIRVLDLTRALAGPFCTMVLGDLGADVIKVEPAGGDMIRHWGPFDRGTSAYYLSGNRNKRGIAVNFRDPRALDLLRDLAGQYDVIVENFRAGAMESMGLGYEALIEANPRLIYASVTGFGRTGPASQRPGFDQIAQGYSGLMSVTGMPESGPVRVGVAIGDQTAGMWCAIGILAAVAQRHATGRGRRVETSLLAGLVGLMSVQAQRYLSLGEIPGLAGNTHPVIAPYGVFQTADGPLNIAPATAEMWRRLCEVLGLQALIDDPRYETNAARIERRAELKELIEARLKAHTRKEWTERLLNADIPAGPIYDVADVFADEQVVHSRLVEQVRHPELGAIRQVGSPIAFDSRHGESIRRAPPLLGEHTFDVLREHGFITSDLEALAREGIILQHGHDPKP